MARGFGGRFGGLAANEPARSVHAMPPEVERWNLERETEFLREELARAEARLTELGAGTSGKDE